MYGTTQRRTNSKTKKGTINDKKLVLLILVSVAVYGDNVKGCLGGSVEACDNIVSDLVKIGMNPYRTLESVGQYDLQRLKLNCKDYMKVMRKGCDIGSGRCCVLLGNEFHHGILITGDSQYGAYCSLHDTDETFKYYKKACDLGESKGCEL